MKEQSPNFLTCPAFPELTPPTEASVVKPPMLASEPLKKVSSSPTPPTSPKPQGPKKPHLVRWIVLAVIGVLLVVTVPPGYALVRAFVSAESAKNSLNQVKTSLQNLDAESAKAEMSSAQASLSDAHDALQGVGFWRDMPGVGVQLRALEDATAAGSQTLDGASNLLEVVGVVTDALRGGVEANGALSTGVASSRSYNDLTPDEKRDLLSRFQNELPNLRIAREKIDLALELWSRVPQSQLVSPLRTALQPIADALPKLKESLDEGVPIIEALVPLAGFPNPVRYLVLLQNSDELRPGGGFIGDVGTLSMDGGDMKELNFTDVYNIDNPSSYAWKQVPPAPIAKQLGVKVWYLRDANWSPDFPTSAEKQLEFYKGEVELGTGKKLSDPPTAVIAIEPGFFKALLHLTGPVTVGGQSFGESNFMDLIEYQVEEGFLQQGIPLANRKDLISAIGTAIAAKVKTLPSSRWNELVDVTTKAFEEKQIMAYSQDPALLKVLDDRGWTARAKATNGDFLWVVDANLAALKTDGMMNKKVSYKLDVTDPLHPKATVTLTYHNNTKAITWRYTRYRSYTRVYVPDGATLISSSGATIQGPVDVTKELGKTAFGAFWTIEPQQTQTLSFTYALPTSILMSGTSTAYHLDWLKQAGADSTALTLDLSFGKTLLSASPPEDKSKWGDAKYEYETDSLQDRSFDLTF